MSYFSFSWGGSYTAAPGIRTFSLADYHAFHHAEFCLLQIFCIRFHIHYAMPFRLFFFSSLPLPPFSPIRFSKLFVSFRHAASFLLFFFFSHIRFLSFSLIRWWHYTLYCHHAFTWCCCRFYAMPRRAPRHTMHVCFLWGNVMKERAPCRHNICYDARRAAICRARHAAAAAAARYMSVVDARRCCLFMPLCLFLLSARRARAMPCHAAMPMSARARSARARARAARAMPDGSLRCLFAFWLLRAMPRRFSYVI